LFYRSRRLKFIFGSILSFLALFIFFRLFFVVFFFGELDGPATELIRALWVGVRFDLRLAVFIIVPVGLFFMIPFINPLRTAISRRLVNIYLRTVSVLVTFFYAFDIAHYGYLNHRIDVSAFKLLENPMIALQMVWESYPVVWSIIGLSILIWATWRAIEKAFQILEDRQRIVRFRNKFFGFTMGGLILLFSIWGTFRQYRLLWSDAYFSEDPFIVAAGLNPILYFNETRSFVLEDFNEGKTREYYDLMIQELGVKQPDSKRLSYVRTVDGREIKNQPNIVIIFLESVGYNRMARSGNPLNATPNLDQLSTEGIFFDRFYIPMVGTARSVFGMVTGIHDVVRVETASSNPRIVDQYSLINALTGYEKYYIMGGSASWRNIRGLLQNNIPDMQIKDQDDLDFPRLDVWGISDNDLFKVAHETFQNIDQSQPFFAIVQTATNHRPYSIPKNIEGFDLKDVDETVLSNAGFDSNEQYNAMRMLDHAVGEYISSAKTASYFNNTIFLFFGDHGTSDPRALHMPKSDYDLKLRSYQVPFFIYGPELIKGGIVRNDVSQLVDLLPTVNGLAGKPYENRTMGRDLLNGEIPIDPLALIINKKMAKPHIAVIGQNYYLSMANRKGGPRVKLHELWSDKPLVNVKDKYPEITDRYLGRLKGIYETTKYMLYHNQK
jgi:phosphoglycerol transferase MdoB-like AlkP superfamily enzyme